MKNLLTSKQWLLFRNSIPAKKARLLCFPVFTGVVFFFATSCTKDESIRPASEISVLTEALNEAQPTVIDNITEVVYPHDYSELQEPFDWERLEYLPLPSNYQPVPMPWSDQANRRFSEDIRYDYKRADGWELYLNSSSSEYRTGWIFFSLYNKYRGIYRCYYYVESGTQDVQEYNILQNHFRAEWETPILNFATQRIIDVSQNVLASYTFEPQSLSDYAWHAIEFELAYDKNIYQQDWTKMIGFSISMLKAQSLMVNETPLQELNGKINIYDSEYNGLGFNAANATYTLYGASDVNQTANSLTTTDLTQLNEVLQTRSYQKVLSGVLPQASSTNFKWNIALDFVPEPSGAGAFSVYHSVSGANLSSVQGDAPFYEKALGVFYLNKNPAYSETEHADQHHPYQYALDVSSVEYLFNPAVLQIAEIKNLQQELVATEQETLVKDQQGVSLFTGQLLKSNKPLVIQGVRVSFDVVPKDGGESVHIIKTFKANLKTTN